MTKTYKNREGNLHKFTKDDNHNILWEGDFAWCRHGGKVVDEEGVTYIEHMVDPYGGPYIGVDYDLKPFGFPNYIVDKFQMTETGYKIITKKCPMCHLAGGNHKMGCETRKVTVFWDQLEKEVHKSNSNLNN